MAREAISEHLISKNFLGEHSPQTPLVLPACLLITYMHTYTSDIDVTPLQKILATGLVPFMSVLSCSNGASPNQSVSVIESLLQLIISIL